MKRPISKKELKKALVDKKRLEEEEKQLRLHEILAITIFNFVNTKNTTPKEKKRLERKLKQTYRSIRHIPHFIKNLPISITLPLIEKYGFSSRQLKTGEDVIAIVHALREKQEQKESNDTDTKTVKEIQAVINTLTLPKKWYQQRLFKPDSATMAAKSIKNIEKGENLAWIILDFPPHISLFSIKKYGFSKQLKKGEDVAAVVTALGKKYADVKGSDPSIASEIAIHINRLLTPNEKYQFFRTDFSKRLSEVDKREIAKQLKDKKDDLPSGSKLRSLVNAYKASTQNESVQLTPAGSPESDPRLQAKEKSEILSPSSKKGILYLLGLRGKAPNSTTAQKSPESPSKSLTNK